MSATSKSKASGGLAAALTLVVVPVLAGAVWLSFGSGQTPAPSTGGPDVRSVTLERDRLSLPPPVTPQRQPVGARSGAEMGAHSGNEGVAEGQTAHPLTAAPSTAAGEDDERIGRFDENARSFDARLESFEKERDTLDETASSSVQEGLHRVLEPLHPGLEVTARCTDSVCVVDLSSEDSVGTMIARIAPWLRQSSDVATGDPMDPEDERGMRLAFEKSEVMALVDQPPELLP